MPLEQRLATILTTCGVPVPFAAWLDAEGLTSATDLGLLATSEDNVKSNILDVAASAGVKFETLKQRLALTKAWLQCRAITDREHGVRCGKLREHEDEPLDLTVVLDIETKWHNRHKFNLPTARVLVDPLLAKRFRQVNSTPRKFSVLMAEQIRTRACPTKATSKALVQGGDGTVGVEESVADGIFDHHELFVRIRADFTTIALVSIDHLDFFEFQDCETFLEKISGFLYQRFKGSLAPVSFYKEAYVHLQQHIVEEIQTNKRTLKTTLSDVSAWVSRWTSYRAPDAAQAVDSGAGSGVVSQPDLHEDLKKELRRLEQKARDLALAKEEQKKNFVERLNQRQQELDKERAKARKGQNNTPRSQQHEQYSSQRQDYGRDSGRPPLKRKRQHS